MKDLDDRGSQLDQTHATTRALALFHEGYELQVQGLWADAMACYRESIRLHPTPEAHTFLGWVYSFLKLYDEAIAECRKAIAIDPAFGNPYNDIGAYLVEQGRLEDAIPWFERAIQAPRYDARCYPFYNLGRVYEKKGQWAKAIGFYCMSLRENPTYNLARIAWMTLQARMN